jgi:hypothetical protein
MDKRQRQHQIAKLLHERVGSPEVIHLLELLNILREDARENLVMSDKASFKHNQGRVRAFDDLARMITVPSPVIPRSN